MPAIEVKDLRKRYGSFEALRGVSFQVEHGEVVGFLGPNGAGKSTAMKILTGYLAPTGGSAAIEGHDVLTEPIAARERLGYLPESAPIYPDMRVGEYLDFVGQVRGLGAAERDAAIRRVAAQVGIEPRLRQLVGELSKGYRQRVGLAQALIHNPSILILDEPTTGLDPNQIVEIRNVIREIGRHKTVMLSTHILSEVQATCDRVIIVHKGEIVADGPTGEITLRDQGGLLLRVVLCDGKVALTNDAVTEALAGLDGVERVRHVEAEDPRWHAYEVLAARDVRAEVFRLAVDRGLVLLELSLERSSLEGVFRRLTRG